MAEFENRPQESAGEIPHIEIAELVELGIRDLPKAYFQVIGAKDGQPRQPLLEEHIVDTSDEALENLPDLERVVIKELLLTRQMLMEPETGQVYLMAVGSGAVERDITETDFALMAQLDSALRKGYRYAHAANPHIIYANGYGEAPKVGDVIIPGRQRKTRLYSWSEPEHYELSPNITIKNIGLYPEEEAGWQEKIALFRLPEGQK